MWGYWVTFDDGSAGYCEAALGDSTEYCEAALGEHSVIEIAERITGKKVHSINPLPYPAQPIIHQVSRCPPFCFSPARCQGHTACPREISCTE